MTSALEGLVDRSQWRGIQSIGMVESQREIDGEVSVERRYYISSLEAGAEQFGAAVRSHWGIEKTSSRTLIRDRLHWCLDMTFREDESRVRKDHGPDNMAILRHLTLNLLRQEKPARPVSVGNVSKPAGMRSTFLKSSHRPRDLCAIV